MNILTLVAAAAVSGPATPKVPVPTVDQMLHSTPDEIFATAAKQTVEAKRASISNSVPEMVNAAITQGARPLAPMDETAVRTEAIGAAADIQAQKQKQSYTFWDRFKAGMEETLAAAVIRSIGQEARDYDPAYPEFFRKNRDSVMGFAQTDDETNQLFEATSQQHLSQIQTRIMADRVRAKVINSSDMGTAVRLGTNALTFLPMAALLLIAVRGRRKPAKL